MGIRWPSHRVHLSSILLLFGIGLGLVLMVGHLHGDVPREWSSDNVRQWVGSLAPSSQFGAVNAGAPLAFALIVYGNDTAQETGILLKVRQRPDSALTQC